MIPLPVALPAVIVSLPPTVVDVVSIRVRIPAVVKVAKPLPCAVVDRIDNRNAGIAIDHSDDC